MTEETYPVPLAEGKYVPVALIPEMVVGLRQSQAERPAMPLRWTTKENDYAMVGREMFAQLLDYAELGAAVEMRELLEQRETA